VVLLDVATAPPADLGAALAAVAADAGWTADAVGPVASGSRGEVLRALAADGSRVLRAGVHPDGVVVAARHDALDGLAMLTAASRLLGTELRSSARGVADHPGGGAAALVQRAWEVGVRPQARVAATGHPDRDGDAFAAVTVDGEPRTADLVLAGGRAVVAWNREHGRRARRVSVAVGVSTVGGDVRAYADHSAFLRLRGVERMSAAEVAAALGTAPLQPGGGDAPGRLVALAVRLAAPRLGSTLLVSHLGRVGGDLPLAFYPVTGGGSGLSVGAATVGGRTTITARGRAARYDDEELEHLLELLVGALA
jgi:hypothetical protein